MANKSQTPEITEKNEVSEGVISEKKNIFSGLIDYFRTIRKKVRIIFSKQCEDSILSVFFDNLYYSILNTPIKAYAVFLTTISILSLLFGYLLNNKDVISFILDLNNISSLIIFVCGLILFSSKKTVAEIITTSSTLSKLSIVYSQSAVFSAHTGNAKPVYNYSTAIFIGIIFGILSINFPPVYLILFLLCIIYSVFIFSRPECGLMLTVASTVIFNETATLMITFITFIGLLYKYLRGKRHIDLNIHFAIIITAIIYFILRGPLANGNNGLTQLLSHIAFFIVCISTMSLVRSTSMLNRTFNLIISISRLYLVIFICYYISCIIFGLSITNSYLSALSFTGLESILTNVSLFASITIFSIPLNFGVMISSKNATGFIKNVVFFIITLLCSGFIGMIEYTLVAMLSCIIVLFFIKKRFAMLALLTPFFALGVNWLFNFTPDKFIVSFFQNSDIQTNTFKNLIGKNIAFGIGIGSNATNQIYVENSILSLLLYVGIVGIIILAVIIALMLFNCLKFIINSSEIKTLKARILAVSLFSACISFIINCFIMNCLIDFRIICLFAVILSLSYVSQHCFNSDYIDPSSIREYKLL